MCKKPISLILLWWVCSVAAVAQQANYKAAQKFDAPNLNKLIGTTKVIPFFLKNGRYFWFIADEPILNGKQPDWSGDSLVAPAKKNTHYIVNLATGKKQSLFDKPEILRQLKALTGQMVEEKDVMYWANFSEDEKSVIIKYGAKTYDYNYETKKITLQVNKAPITKTAGFGVSADGNWTLYSKAHNLYIAATANKKNERQLSFDAEPYFSFCVDQKGTYTTDKTYPSNAKWLGDRYFYALRVDTRKVATLAVISSAITPRPRVSTYKYELPGDKDVAQYELYIGNAESGSFKKVDLKRWPDQQLEVIEAQGNTKEVFVIRRKRSRDEMELCAVDLASGNVRSIIQETSKPFINEDFFYVSFIKGGKEIIWWSDRTGWGQYYRYNSEGHLLNRITKGNFTAGKIMSIDTVKGDIYLYGYGKERNINPYYAMLYKVALNGKNEQLLTPENATHQVYISPDRKYFVDNYSRIDLAPVTVLRKIDGKTISEVLRPNVSNLYAYGWKNAEPFTVKAKDGVTDLYGLIWKPFDFDPAKKYPVISQVYPGPQIETVWNDFTVLDKYNNAALAQIGFIVVAVGHRGGSPIRNAEYYKYGYGNLRDYAIDDDKCALEQLAKQHPFMDLDRVGIFGHSGGGMMTVAAMGKYPDFYQVGVASSGNHDNRIYNRTWGETYQGLENKMPLNEDLAKKIKGHLMLVTGEVDENVNPANTYRMVDALIKADKDFDLMVLPGQDHHYEGAAKLYFEKRMRAYFAKYFIEQNISTDRK
ncbi:Dipeptidyl aminopeptidase/acylaminoacyl peptidase [Pedobacter suwonensis]|uniref:Dipeptidyl aminopeptidase/acylaminoacyl peptidase n=1 Tax=Pedobacter suwonensis TaxID=332999 RepID=A0A1I0SMH5_9SPHI|nr:prolyl oligopeptidase family serine peptidase [Pedobacter suwonensis]SFA40725.1 Dipeptidyl aminopeptidase/acylaminoacyl peptidase [Pedobacter suwonensis]